MVMLCGWYNKHAILETATEGIVPNITRVTLIGVSLKLSSPPEVWAVY
jgi:hypothetical protein